MGVLKKLLWVVLALCLTGCLTPLAAQAGNGVGGQGQPLKFKKKFHDNLSVGRLPGYPLFLTKKSELTKQQAVQLGSQRLGFSLSFVGKTIYGPGRGCEGVVFNAQPIQLDQFLKQMHGISVKDLVSTYVVTPEESKQEATLITMPNCQGFYWSNQLVVLKPKAYLETQPAYGTRFLLWKSGVVFSATSRMLL